MSWPILEYRSYEARLSSIDLTVNSVARQLLEYNRDRIWFRIYANVPAFGRAEFHIGTSPPLIGPVSSINTSNAGAAGIWNIDYHFEMTYAVYGPLVHESIYVTDIVPSKFIFISVYEYIGIGLIRCRKPYKRAKRFSL